MSEQQIKMAGYATSIVAMALIILSFQCKKRSAFYAMQMSGNVVFAISFLLLGNIAASLMNLVGLFRGIIMLFPQEKRKIWHLVLINALFVGGALLAGTVGGEGLACLVSLRHRLWARSACGTLPIKLSAGCRCASFLLCGSSIIRRFPSPREALCARCSVWLLPSYI